MTCPLVLCQHTRYITYMLQMAEAKREHDRVFQMRVSDAFLMMIDDWRRKQADLPARAEAVRRLVEKAIKTEGGGQI